MYEGECKERLGIMTLLVQCPDRLSSGTSALHSWLCLGCGFTRTWRFMGSYKWGYK